MSFTSKWNLITFAPAYPPRVHPFPYFFRSPPLGSPCLLSPFSLFSFPAATRPLLFHFLRSLSRSLLLPPSCRLACLPTHRPRGPRSSTKIFKFRRLVQRKLSLSPPRPTRQNSAATFRPIFSYPRPNYIAAHPAVLFTAQANTQMPSRLYPAARSCIIVEGRDKSREKREIARFPSFFLVMPGRGNCLLSFEIAATPLSFLLPYLVINFAFTSPPPLLETRYAGESLCSLHG